MEEAKFITVASLLCEPSRAKIVWNLLDGKAYTATELALASNLSSSAVSNHLSKLLQGNILKVNAQGRHRYYSFANDHVSHVVESLASLSKEQLPHTSEKEVKKTGIKYCRTCYDHLAGYVGVTITEAMVKEGFLLISDTSYLVSKKGWNWLTKFNILESNFAKSRRPLTRQCLDWSERRIHLSGHLGAVLLGRMLAEDWFRRVEFSRELIITSKGRKCLYDVLGINFS